MKRWVCVITGTRAEYGLLKPVMEAIIKDRKLELLLMVTCMHLSREFGRTIDLIKKDNFKITYKVRMNPVNDNALAMAVSLGKAIIGIAREFERKRPDLTLILGDRIEALAGAIASAYLNIPVAHIHGGDISKAGLDESARHAITKIAHIHFVATRNSQRRIIKMGEAPRNVFLVGAPGLDSILQKPIVGKKWLAKKYSVDFSKPLLLLLEHSVTTAIEEAGSQIRQTLAAIKKLRLNTLIIYPNSDAGGRAIIKEIEKCRGVDFIKIARSIPHEDYLGFLKYCSVFIGNSSSGIIESASLRLPVVNIGSRQAGRERSINVIDVKHNREAIVRAVKKALYDKAFKARVKKCHNPYGDGRASSRIVKVLRKIKLDKNLLQKQITY